VVFLIDSVSKETYLVSKETYLVSKEVAKET
jgi:hypothetical protein